MYGVVFEALMAGCYVHQDGSQGAKNVPVEVLGPGSKQGIALVNLVPRSLTVNFF
jgi:hypothetical protein